MKILNYGKEKKIEPLIITCDQCGSRLEVEKGDSQIGEYGCSYVVCPVCTKKLYMGDYVDAGRFDQFVLTMDNVEFPTHFCSMGEDATEVTSDEIKRDIRTAIECFRKNPEERIWYTAYGDMAMYVHNFPGDEEFYVVVAKGYYDTYIPYTNVDKKIFKELVED